MNKKLIIGVVLLLALAAIYFFYYGNPASAPTQNSEVGGTSVTIKGFAFNPSTLTVARGATVTWTNEDSASHDIKSANFISPALIRGGSFSYTFDQAGTYDYSCGIHPSMKGIIIVQ